MHGMNRVQPVNVSLQPVIIQMQVINHSCLSGMNGKMAYLHEEASLAADMQQSRQASR